MKKRFLSLLMVLCLTLSLAPAALAMDAEDNLVGDQIAADVSGETAPSEEKPSVPSEEEPSVPSEEEHSVPSEEEHSVPSEEEPSVPSEEEPPVPSEEEPLEDPVEQSTVPDESVTVPAPDAQPPTITSFAITEKGQTYTSVTNSDGSMYLTLPNSARFLDCTLSLTASEPVNFLVAENRANVGNMYVSSASGNSATLNFNIQLGSHDMNEAVFGTTVDTTDYVVWEGERKINVGDLINIPLSSVIAAFSAYENLGLAAGSMESISTGAVSEFQPVICNQDNETALLISCENDRVIHTVTYECSNTTYEWKLPDGAPLVMPKPVLQDGQTFEGWYADAEYTEAISEDATVTGNMTLYAKITSSIVDSSFNSQLDSGASVLTITNLNDWNAFIQRASEVTADQRVELTEDIDCNGAAYTALAFAGDFNGKGHTISNATFNANGSNSGMFAVIGSGQKIVNLTLSDITVGYAENAGVLAGSISAANGNPALIQNVQIRGGKVNGRNMGALVGYTFLSDIKYCSSRGTTFSGAVNAGGIAGISYSAISYCYSTCGLGQFTLSKGGIVAKNQEAGRVEWCWTTYNRVYASAHADSSASDNIVNAGTVNQGYFERNGFDDECWIPANGSAMDFDYEVISYSFDA